MYVWERKVKRLCLVKAKWRRNQKLENLKMIGHEKLVYYYYYYFHNYIFFEKSTWILINMGSNDS
jgi:hypothetical protein